MTKEESKQREQERINEMITSELLTHFSRDETKKGMGTKDTAPTNS